MDASIRAKVRECLGAGRIVSRAPFCLLLALALLSACRPESQAPEHHPDQHQDQHQHSPAAPVSASGVPASGQSPAANPLQQEMRQLDLAFREVVSAAIVSDGKRLLKALEPLHGTMEHTRHALDRGLIRLPRNQDRLPEFLAMDAAFHQELEQLAQAAQSQKGQAMISHSQSLIKRCFLCHQDFRSGF